jgi:hypothetical protein
MEVFGCGEHRTNLFRYATEFEAREAGRCARRELLSSRFIPTDYRATPTEDPVNSRFYNGRSELLPGRPLLPRKAPSLKGLFETPTPGGADGGGGQADAGGRLEEAAPASAAGRARPGEP